ncbi:MAG: hypothetical protein JNK02_15670 [Planctomycetes bacterium]|nr:hypothetical protein [Planctomycetota bacterium]
MWSPTHTPAWILAALCALAPAFEPLQKGGARDKDKEKKTGTPARGAQAPPPLAPWRGKLLDARAAAKERNVPLLIHVILDQEESNDRYRDTVLPDPDLLRRSAAALVILANNGQHPPKRVEIVVDGETTSKEVCSVYPMFARCSEHRAPWDELYLELREEDGDMKCPQTAVFLPDGKLVGRINTSSAPEPAEVSALLAEALVKAGPGLTEEQLALVKQRLAEGRELAARADWVGAWHAWNGVLALTQASAFAEEARREEPKALAGMRAAFETIAARLVPGSAAQAFADLSRFAADVVGTPLEKDVQQRLKRAEADKAIAAEIKAWRLALEADALLREATDFADAGETKKSERVIKRLLAPKYAGTPAQDTARKLWPDVTPG